MKYKPSLERFWYIADDYNSLDDEIELIGNSTFSGMITKASEDFRKTHEKLLTSIEDLVYKHTFKH